MKPDRLLRFLRAHFRACLLPALLTSQVTAQTFTWDGGGGDDLFGTNTNWSGDTSPSTGSGVILEFTGSTRTTPENNYSTGDNFGEWHLLSGAGSDFTITGNGFGLYGKIENDSGSGYDLTINTAGIYARDGSIEFNPVGGDLTIGALVTLDDNAALNVYDGGNGNTLTLNGVLSGGNGSGGNGSLVLNQTANVILANDNTYGGTVINSGTTLQVGTGGTTGSLGVGNTANDGSLIINRSNAYTYSGVLSGSGTLAKLGAGTLTLTGSNTHTGKTTVSGGVLSIASDANLGTAPGSATADQLTLDGGTLVITGATTLDANRGVTIGSSGGTIDTSALGTGTGYQVVIAGNLSGSNGLTVKAHGNLSASGGSSNSFLQFGGDNSGLSGGIAITGGLVDVLTDNALGANQITLTNGGGIVNANHGTRSLANDIVVSTGGGTLRNWGSATTNYSGSISGSNFINRTDGGTINLTGDLSGFNGAFNHQAGTTKFQTGANALDGTLTVSAGEVAIENSATNTYSAVNLNAGTLRVKSNNNALGSATLAVGGNAIFASQIGSSALTFTNDATIAGTSTLSFDPGYAAITWNGDITGTGTKVRTSSSGTLTLGGTVNMGSTSSGNVSVESNGTMTLASGAVVTAGSVFNNNNAGTLNINGATVDTGTLSLTSNGGINLNSGTLTAAQVALTNQTGTFNITGGTLNTQYLNIGNASNNSGRIVQTGGTVNVNAGGSGFRIGHWNNGGNAGSVYNISGGLLDASTQTINIGWDGQGDMVVGGGAGTATVKANKIQLDANGNGGGGTGGNMTLTVSSNGLVEVGPSGIASASTSDIVILDGGTLKAIANSTWSSYMTANASTNSVLSADETFTATASGVISGPGAVTTGGLGTVVLSGGNSFAGGLTVSEGTLEARNSAALGTGAIVNNATLFLNASGSSTWTPAMTGSGDLRTANAVTFGSGTDIDLGGQAYRIGTGSVTVEAGASLSFGGRVRLSAYNGSQRAATTITGGSLTVTGDATDNRDSWFDVTQSGGVVTVGRLLSNQTEPSQNGGGTSGNSTYTLTGGEFITGGISGGTGAAWSRGIALHLGGGTLTASGAFNMAANTVNLTGVNGDVTINTAGFDIGSNYGFSGSGGFDKSGEGTLTLSQAGTYSGATVVSGGRLLVSSTLRNSSEFTARDGGALEFGATNIFVGGHGIALADSRVITADNATLLMNGSFDARFGNVTLMNGATWTSNRALTGYDALLANTDAGAATVTVTNTGGNTSGSVMNGSGGIHLQGEQVFHVNDVTGDSAADLSVSMTLDGPGSIGGTGALRKTGAGTMAISQRTSYTGGTTVAEGVLDLTGGGGAAGTIRGTVTVESGATLRLSSGDVTGYGTGSDRLSTIAIDGGTMHVNTSSNQTLGNASIVLTGGSITGVAGSNLDFFQGSSSLGSLASATTSTISGVQLSIRQTAGLNIDVEDGAAATDLHIDSVIATKSGTAPLIKSGDGTLALGGINSYTGETQVNAGTLLVNGSHTGSGTVSVASGATLGGTGSLVAAVNVTGSLSPGASIESLSMGSLSLLDGSTLVYEASNGDSNLGDLLAIDGDFNLTGLVNLDLSGADLSDSGWALGSKLSIASYTGSWNNGTFSGFSNASTHTFGVNEWEIRYDDTNPGSNFTGEQAGSYVTLTLVPEPTSAVFALISITGLLLRRRR
ncbi:MAG: autotransporter-associated beta strand repeat-containing protein [Akkermansiaceae bacterium]|nr:autotransporter-associated beta strand repeat-containing protein [Akkermansiaceae bacterium]